MDAAVREVHEEIGISLDAQWLTQLGMFEETAHNEAEHTVVATVFTYDGSTVTPHTAAEIAELSWVSPNRPVVALAPLLAYSVFPALAS